MRTAILSIMAICGSHILYAQGVGINTLKPDPSAALDIVSDNKGLLIPRVDLKSLTDGKTIDKPAHSLLVFNYNPKLPGGEGYYFNAGTKDAPDWKKFALHDANSKVAFSVAGIESGKEMIQPFVPTKVAFATEKYDLAGNYQGSGSPEHTFTVPVSGIYHFDVKTGFLVNAAGNLMHDMRIVRVRNGISSTIALSEEVITVESGLSIDCDLELGDQVYVEVTHKLNYNGKSLPLNGNVCYFVGRLVHSL